MTSFDCALKRSFDLLFASLGLCVFSIPMLLIGCAIKLTSRGSVLFIQKRVGRHKQIIRMHKFRTMYVREKAGTSITVAHDPRITPVGKILRSLKLDELPQLIDVLRGTMSFVGPRPDVAGYADLLVGDDAILLCLRPGITGPASIMYRKEEELLAKAANPTHYNNERIWPHKVSINKRYAQEWSFWGDVRYILMTLVPALIPPSLNMPKLPEV